VAKGFDLKPEIELPDNIDRLFDLSGKVVLVTTAASGLGLAIAYGMAKYGADVACADLNLSGAEKTASRIREWGRKSLAIEYNVTDWDQVKKMVEKTVDHFGRIDISFNLPGINIRKTVEDLEPEEYYQIIDVNLKGMFNLCKAVGEIMIRQKRGKIINMSSIFGLCAMGRQSGYASSKHGVLGLTKVLAIEWAKYNIQVNAICPGYHMTPRQKQVVSDRAWYDEIISKIPQRRFAKPWEIIGPAVFLASEATSFITGSALICDGGWTAQ
jgi:NAD(P)-dependent dehydrogenase (short-subunit alcohol dehydrogenase family)